MNPKLPKLFSLISLVLFVISCSSKTNNTEKAAKERAEQLFEELDETFLFPLEESIESGKGSIDYHNFYGSEQSHTYANMGLSVNWAVENVGAYNPNGFGNYYWWANIVPNTDDNCEYPESCLGNISGDPKYDAARARWGGRWRLPTKSEFEELITNCVIENFILDEIKGKLFTSKINGCKIFLPYAGIKYDDEYELWIRDIGEYWSSIPTHQVEGHAVAIEICDSREEPCFLNADVYNGLSIRPVCNNYGDKK